MVNFTIRRLGGKPPVAVSLPGDATLLDLKDAIAEAVSVGPLAFKLIKEDCTVLMGSLDAKLTELDLGDGAALTLITDSARDYSRITGPEKVLKTGHYPNGILIDKEGYLYVTHYWGELKVYDSSFQEVRQTKTPTHPRQLALAPSGELVAAFNDGIRVFDPATLTELRCFGDFQATGVAVEGEFVYASDSRRNVIQVHQFKDGKLIGTHNPGLRSPQALVVVEGRLLAVADRGNDRVLLLNIDTLQVQSQLPLEGAPAKQHLSRPNDVIVDSAGNLLVMDTGHERIAVFREDGSFVASAMEGFFRDHGNTFSYLFYNHITGAIAVSNNDEHCITVFSPIFKTESLSPAEVEGSS